MRIAEIASPPDSHRNRPDPNHHHHNQQHQLLLSQFESLITQTETLSSKPETATTVPSDLRQTLTHFTQLSPFPNSVKLHLWKLSYRLWNACVDISNSISAFSSSSSSTAISHLHAKLRHIAADMLFLAIDVVGVPSPDIKSVSFYHKTGLIWHGLNAFDLAATCFERATDIAAKIEVNQIHDSDERKLLLELNLARSQTAWELNDKNLTVMLLNRSKTLLFSDAEHYKALANQYLLFGKNVLSKNEESGFNEALKFMNEALDLSEKGLAAARTREHSVELKELKSKTLRFISAVHLQKREYESVIKCVKALREGSGNNSGGSGGDNHASLPVLAMKAWLGLRRYGEAEKELRGMVPNKGVPESVWVSAVEAYFEAAGTAGAETAKGVFLGLLGRCHVSAKAAVRVAHRVVGDGMDSCNEGSRARAKVVAELVSDDRVVELFASDASVKERTAMHAVLWNCAAGHFRSKDYEVSAEMFEKSLLYVPHDLENRILRAKGYRVLSLCYLGLSQLDRAQEYINEAEKLEPNIVCAFLKFKIHLQKDDQSAAINQIQAMRSCLDFSPDFLSLSAHEAIACHALPVAAASLSNLLNFYSTGKYMPVPEVVLLRTLITILTQDSEKKSEVLKYMKWAHTRVSELGADCFFGEGETGTREKNWFAINSWNFGTICGKERNYDLCAEFLRLVSVFYNDQIDGNFEEYNKVMVCKSLILTITSMIASENNRKSTLAEAEVKQAVELLKRAEKMLNSLSTETKEDKITKLEPELFFMYTFNAYDIYGRLDHLGSQQLTLVQRFANSKACNSKHLLLLGLNASQGPRSNHEVATFALSECLAALLSSPSPNYQEIALIVRRLIAVASIHKGDSDDEIVHNMYKQASRIMVGLKEGNYPTEEGKWLAMTAWNRAAIPVRMKQIELAKKWMNVGLELASKVSGMETYKACMEDFLSAFGDKSHS